MEMVQSEGGRDVARRKAEGFSTIFPGCIKPEFELKKKS
jgi:hypothetical protein